MEFKTKRLLSFIIVGGYLFLGGCEYAVILPTAWDYLQTLGATEEYWLGFTVSAYSLSAAFSGLIGGRLSDIYEDKTKRIAMVSIVLMAFGNLQYTLGYSVWNVFVSRLICGIGTAAGSAMLAEVCRVTAIEERTPILAICNATRQLGILIGPVFQLLLSTFNFRIGWLQITPLNAPGVFMGVLWLLFAIATMFMFYNLTAEVNALNRERRAELLRQSSTPTSEAIHKPGVIPSSLINRNLYGAMEDSHASSMVSQSVHNDESQSVTPSGRRFMRPSRRMSMSERFFNSLAQSTAEVRTTHTSVINMSMSRSSYANEFLNDSFILMLTMVFTCFFCQVGVETIIPVVMQDNFGYGEFENSLVYMIGGFEALIVFFMVAAVSRYVRDTTLQVVGWILMIIAQVWLMVVIPYFEPGNKIHLVNFMIGIVILYLGYPITSVGNTGLYSKYLSNETQGLGQGLRRLASYLGLIFGPTWAGSTVKMPYLFLGVSVGIMVLNAVQLAVSHKNMKKIEDKQRASTNEIFHEDEESRSLLSN